MCDVILYIEQTCHPKTVDDTGVPIKIQKYENQIKIRYKPTTSEHYFCIAEIYNESYIN